MGRCWSSTSPVGSWKESIDFWCDQAEGDFSYHDIVSVYHQETGQLLGKGKVRLGQSAVRDLLQSKKAKGILIHRDDWISVTPEIDLLFTEF